MADKKKAAKSVQAKKAKQAKAKTGESTAAKLAKFFGRGTK